MDSHFVVYAQRHLKSDNVGVTLVKLADTERVRMFQRDWQKIKVWDGRLYVISWGLKGMQEKKKKRVTL